MLFIIVLKPRNISKMASMQNNMPNPSTGIKKGWLWFLNELCITTGPKNNRGSAPLRYLMPFIYIFLSVAIRL